MSDNNQQPAAGKKQNPGSNVPTHIAFHVREAKVGKPRSFIGKGVSELN